MQGFGRWASGCALLLRGWSAGGAESLRAAWWGASTIVEAAHAGAGGGVEGGCMRASWGGDLLVRLFAVCVCVWVCVGGRMHVMHAITGCTG